MNLLSRDKEESIGAPPVLTATAFARVSSAAIDVIRRDRPATRIGDIGIGCGAVQRNPAGSLLRIRHCRADHFQHIHGVKVIGGRRSRCLGHNRNSIATESYAERDCASRALGSRRTGDSIVSNLEKKDLIRSRDRDQQLGTVGRESNIVRTRTSRRQVDSPSRNCVEKPVRFETETVDMRRCAFRVQHINEIAGEGNAVRENTAGILSSS